MERMERAMEKTPYRTPQKSAHARFMEVEMSQLYPMPPMGTLQMQGQTMEVLQIHSVKNRNNQVRQTIMRRL